MMTSGPDFHEKRIFTRYPVRDSSAVLLSPGNLVSYSILDISQSGLAFCYSGKVDECSVLNNAIISFFTENDWASDISVQIVSDEQLNEDFLWHEFKTNNSNNLSLRRCGVRFNQLSQAQEDTIHAYLHHQEKGFVIA